MDPKYLFSRAAVRSLLQPYPRVSDVARRMPASPSATYPASEWKVSPSRFAAFMQHCTRADDPSQRLATLEAGLTLGQVPGLGSTRAEDYFIPKLAEQLVLGALASSPFRPHDLPVTSQPSGGSRLPDVTGSISGIGTVCFEIYQPRDESPLMAYLSELQDAIDLADIPWHYMASIFWQWRRSAEDPHARAPFKQRQECIGPFVRRMPEALRSSASEGLGTIEFRDDDLGVVAEVELTRVRPWQDVSEPLERLMAAGWGHHPWNTLDHAEALADKLVRKGRKKQAQSREADVRVLIVDCCATKSFWDMALHPHDGTLQAYCEAISSRLEHILEGLDGLILWAPYVPSGEARRVVAVSDAVPQRIVDALAGCRWKGAVATGSMRRL